VRSHKVLKTSKCRPLRESRDSLDIASWAPFSYPQTILKTTVLDVAKLFPNDSWAWELSKMLIISTLQEKPFEGTLCGLQEYGSFQADTGAFQPICRINKELWKTELESTF
jgi:hypothetical protein